MKKALVTFAGEIARLYPSITVKTILPGPVDTPLARHGVMGKELERKTKIMDTSADVARWIVELMESTKSSLVYEGKGKYVLK